MLAIIIISPLTRFILGEYYKNKGLSSAVVADAVYWNTLSHLDAFFMGGLIPVFSLEKKIRRPQNIFFAAVIIAAGAGIFNFFKTDPDSSYFNNLGYGHGQTELYEHVWHYTCLNIVFASFILSLVSIHRSKFFAFFRTGLENKLIADIGKVSYGMYIFHWGILVYFFNRVFPTENIYLKSALFILYVLIVYLVAKISFTLYESRFLLLKNRLFSKQSGEKKEAPSIVPKPDQVLT